MEATLTIVAASPRIGQEDTDSESNDHDHFETAEDANAESSQADGPRWAQRG